MTMVMVATDLTEEQQLFRETVRDFVEKEIAPIAARTDEEGRFPGDVIEKMGRLGFLGIPVPLDLDGAGGDILGYAIALEEISKACASTALTIAAHTSLCTMPIVRFGGDRLKDLYVPDLATGRKLGAFGLTESVSGSDAAGLRTTARKDGDVYRIDGSKQFITNASFASVFVVAARVVDDDAPIERTNRRSRSSDIGAFVVTSDLPGFSVGRKEDKLGLRGSDTAALRFEDCIVPADHRLGGDDGGFAYFMKTLVGGRIGIGAMAVGVAQAALDFAVDHALTRRAFGRSLSEFGATREKVADMATGIHAARLLVYDAARRYIAGRPHVREAAMAKLFASETANRVTREAIQVLGANGYSREYPLERFFRDMKLLEIGEGTSEIQRLIIARDLFGSDR